MTKTTKARAVRIIRVLMKTESREAIAVKLGCRANTIDNYLAGRSLPTASRAAWIIEHLGGTS